MSVLFHHFFSNRIKAIQFLLKNRNKIKLFQDLNQLDFSPKAFLESSSLIEEIKIQVFKSKYCFSFFKDQLRLIQ